jgi:excisionase family DNA binding protein
MPKRTPAHIVGLEPATQKQLNLMTLQEAAAYARVSISTVRRWVRGGELRVYHAGRKSESMKRNW